MNINTDLLLEIEEYCRINGIDDIEKEVNKLLRKGFNVEKYGISPFQHYDSNIVNFSPKEEKIKKEEIEEEIKIEKPKRKVRIIKND